MTNQNINSTVTSDIAYIDYPCIILSVLKDDGELVNKGMPIITLYLVDAEESVILTAPFDGQLVKYFVEEEQLIEEEIELFKFIDPQQEDETQEDEDADATFTPDIDYIEYPCIILSFSNERGDWVKKGWPILSVYTVEAEEQVILLAPYDGQLIKYYVEEEQLVEQKTKLFEFVKGKEDDEVENHVDDEDIVADIEENTPIVEEPLQAQADELDEFESEYTEYMITSELTSLAFPNEVIKILAIKGEWIHEGEPMLVLSLPVVGKTAIVRAPFLCYVDEIFCHMRQRLQPATNLFRIYTDEAGENPARKIKKCLTIQYGNEPEELMSQQDIDDEASSNAETIELPNYSPYKYPMLTVFTFWVFMHSIVLELGAYWTVGSRAVTFILLATLSIKGSIKKIEFKIANHALRYPNLPAQSIDEHESDFGWSFVLWLIIVPSVIITTDLVFPNDRILYDIFSLFDLPFITNIFNDLYSLTSRLAPTPVPTPELQDAFAKYMNG